MMYGSVFRTGHQQEGPLQKNQVLIRVSSCQKGVFPATAGSLGVWFWASVQHLEATVTVKEQNTELIYPVIVKLFAFIQ